jgi:thiol peroxidase
MSRSGAVTFKGTPLTLAGQEVKVGQQAPDFTLHYFDNGLKTIKLSDLKGKPSFISVVPSLDTPVCQIQTKKFNEQVAAMGDRINAVTVSLDLPFAMNRFCGAESIKNMRCGSDYQDRNFGKNYGMLIEELKLLARGVFVLDASGKGSRQRAELRRRIAGAQELAVAESRHSTGNPRFTARQSSSLLTQRSEVGQRREARSMLRLHLLPRWVLRAFPTLR